MLRRSEPPTQSSDEQTEGQARTIRTVIVIGASARGGAAIGTVRVKTAELPNFAS